MVDVSDREHARALTRMHAHARPYMHAHTHARNTPHKHPLTLIQFGTYVRKQKQNNHVLNVRVITCSPTVLDLKVKYL